MSGSINEKADNQMAELIPLLHDVARALGIFDGARAYPATTYIRREILPAVEQLRKGVVPDGLYGYIETLKAVNDMFMRSIRDLEAQLQTANDRIQQWIADHGEAYDCWQKSEAQLRAAQQARDIARRQALDEALGLLHLELKAWMGAAQIGVQYAIRRVEQLRDQPLPAPPKETTP